VTGGVDAVMDERLQALSPAAWSPRQLGNRWLLGWILACTLAETIGMTAAATAARIAEILSLPGALAIIVSAGLIEGLALGLLQGAWLHRRFPRLSPTSWLLVTAVFAGLGWAAASLPGQLGDAGMAVPPLGVTALGALALGALMGAVLGVVQAFVLRGAVRHPWRWVLGSAIAWAPTMVVIFLGATIPDASWSTPVVIAMGTLTGAVAGAVLGLGSAVVLDTLDGSPIVSRLVMTFVKLSRSTTYTVLRITGKRSGGHIELPVQYAAEGATLVVYPSHSERKNWWHNVAAAAPVAAWLDGRWRVGVGVVVTPDQPGWAAACAIYGARFPKVTVSDDVLVRIRLLPWLDAATPSAR
jgi:hypothetical protein